MMTFVAKVRKWGNSMGIVLPKEIVERQQLKQGDEVAVDVGRFVRSIKDILGDLPPLKLKESAQELKDYAREGWLSKTDRENGL